MPTKVKVANNAFGELATSITSSSTTIVLAAGNGARFPSLSIDEYFYATLVNLSNETEIVRVTSRTTDTLTVIRAQDGTTARAYDAGDRIELRPVAALFNDLIAQGNAASGITFSGSAIEFTAENVQEAIVETFTKNSEFDSSTIALVSSTIRDAVKELCTLPISTRSANYTLSANDTGGLVSISSGNITIPTGVFTPSQVVVIYNNSSTTRSIVRASGVTLYWFDGVNADRDLAQRGVATILCVGENEFVISGQGVL